jgi:rhodanese-related sulfurtransferase
VAEINAVTPEEAAQLMSEGRVYVDVRSEAEFEQGHPPGALNVPVSTRGVPNPDFVAVMQAAFGRDEALILGCGSGPRSRRAAGFLAEAGFTQLSEMPAGWDGARDAFGRVEPGWKRKGLPIETGKPSGQSYDDVKKRTPR